MIRSYAPLAGRGITRLCAALFVCVSAGVASALAQFDSSGAHLRQPDRPITAPSLPGLDAPGLSTNPLRYLDSIGATSSDDMLKSLDKDLGRSSTNLTGDPARDRPLEGPRYRPGEDFSKDPAALSTFRPPALAGSFATRASPATERGSHPASHPP
jgi:hypothetical protein